MLFNFSRVAGMDDVFIGRFVLIWNLIFLLITNSTRYWLGSMHESLEFQILSGIKVSYENVFYPIFVRLIGLICGITLLCITGTLHTRDVDEISWPGISRDQKIPGLKDPGILKLRKSWNKKSRDYECIKIPGYLNESWDIPVGFFPLL